MQTAQCPVHSRPLISGSMPPLKNYRITDKRIHLIQDKIKQNLRVYLSNIFPTMGLESLYADSTRMSHVVTGHTGIDDTVRLARALNEIMLMKQAAVSGINVSNYSW